MGSFGACLMLHPHVVQACVLRMRDATQGRVPITVKCRIGVDERDDYEFFAAFADAAGEAAADAVIVHARAAVLGGLTPQENREIPPLKYDYVRRLKRERPTLTVVLNGGLSDSAACLDTLSAGLDGIMLGRAAYHRPALLGELERAVFDPHWRIPTPWQIIERIVPYARAQLRQGVRLHSIVRHMQGLMAGREGARAWRRFLSELAGRPDAPPEALFSALPIMEKGVAA